MVSVTTAPPSPQVMVLTESNEKQPIWPKLPSGLPWNVAPTACAVS